MNQRSSIPENYLSSDSEVDVGVMDYFKNTPVMVDTDEIEEKIQFKSEPNPIDDIFFPNKNQKGKEAAKDHNSSTLDDYFSTHPKEVSIEDETSEKQAQSSHKKNRKSAHSRISELVHDKKVALAAAKSIWDMYEDQKQQANLERQHRVVSDETLVETQILAAKHALQLAVDEGDTENQAKALEFLTDLQNRKNNINQFKSNLHQMGHQAGAQDMKNYLDMMVAQTPQYIEPDAPENPYFDQWASQNKWFGKNQNLTLHAVEISNQITNEFDLSGRENDIQGPEFFKELDQRLRASYGSHGQPQRQVSAPTYMPRNGGSSYQNALSPNYSNSSSSSSRGQHRALTPAQKETARHLPYNVSDEKKYQIYAHFLNEGK